MTYSQKYGREDISFSVFPGVSNDDRVNNDYWHNINAIQKIVHTEKLDGENNCLNKHGVFARSHAMPTNSAWTSTLRQKWNIIKYDLGNYELFGENLFAIHSIEYAEIDSHFFVFAVRELDQWLSWEETLFIASAFDMPTVPVIATIDKFPEQALFERHLISLANAESSFHSIEANSGKPCSMEGIVTRNFDTYSVSEFEKNVFKYVRKDHVTTNEHWTKNWKRSPLKNERK